MERLWVGVQVYVEMGIIIETNVLGVWNTWDDALEYVKKHTRFESAIEGRQVIDATSLAAVPVWEWETRPGMWETVTICPLDRDRVVTPSATPTR